MSKQFIRVKVDGFIYDYNEILAGNPECEVLSEEDAYPERFIPEHVEVVVEPAKKEFRVKRKAALDLSTDDIPEAPAYTSPELAAEAAKGMP